MAAEEVRQRIIFETDQAEKSADQLATKVERITGETGKAKTESRDLKKGYADAGDSADKTAMSVSEIRKQTERAEAESRKLSKTIANQEKLTNQWRAELATVERELDKIGDGWRKDLTDLNKRQRRLRFGIKENVADIRQLKISKKQADESSRNLKKMQSGMRSTTKRSGGLLKTIKGIGIAAGISFGVDQLLQFGTVINDMAKEMEQAARKSEIVFGSSLGKVEAAAKETALSIGLTESEFVGAAAGVQDMLVPLGFARSRASDLAVEATELSGAISMWTAGQYDAEESARMLQKALLGETERLKSVGIGIDQNSAAHKRRIKQLQVDEGLTRQQAKALDILAQVQNKTGDAQRSLAEGQESIAVKQAVANAKFRTARERLVKGLTPAVVELTDWFSEAATSVLDFGEDIDDAKEFFAEWYNESKVFRAVVETVAAAVKTNFTVLFHYVKSIFVEPFKLAVATVKAARLALKGQFEAAGGEMETFFEGFKQRQGDFAKGIKEDYDEAIQNIKDGNIEIKEENEKAAEEEDDHNDYIAMLKKKSNAELKALGEDGNEAAKEILRQRKAVWDSERDALMRHNEQIKRIIDEVNDEIRNGTDDEQSGVDIPIDYDFGSGLGDIQEDIQEQTIPMAVEFQEYNRQIAERTKSIYENLKDFGVSEQEAYEMAVQESEKRIMQNRLAAAQSGLQAAGSMFGALNSLIETEAGNSRELALFEIALNTASGIAGAVSQAQSVPFPANLAAIATGITAVLGGIAQAKNALKPKPNLQSVPAFAEGTASVPLGKNPRGVDTVLSRLTYDEAVIPVKRKKQYPGLAEAFVDGDVDRWVDRNYMLNLMGGSVAPDPHVEVHNNFNERNLLREMKKGNDLSRTMNRKLSRLGVGPQKFKRRG